MRIAPSRSSAIVALLALTLALLGTDARASTPMNVSFEGRYVAVSIGTVVSRGEEGHHAAELRRQRPLLEAEGKKLDAFLHRQLRASAPHRWVKELLLPLDTPAGGEAVTLPRRDFTHQVAEKRLRATSFRFLVSKKFFAPPQPFLAALVVEWERLEAPMDADTRNGLVEVYSKDLDQRSEHDLRALAAVALRDHELRRLKQSLPTLPAPRQAQLLQGLACGGWLTQPKELLGYWRSPEQRTTQAALLGLLLLRQDGGLPALRARADADAVLRAWLKDDGQPAERIGVAVTHFRTYLKSGK